MKQKERPANKILYNKHIKRQNNDLVAAMYAMYCNGKSLQDIGMVYKRSRQAIYVMFRSRGYILRSKQLKGLIIIDGISFTEMRGGYLRGTVKGRRMLAHHYVWEKTNGKIPVDHVLHFIDKNPKNVCIENLELIPKNEMVLHFNPTGINQYSKNYV